MPFLSLRNFNIQYFEWEPTLSVQWNTHVRTQFSAKQLVKQNYTGSNAERVTQQSLESENRWSIAGKTNLDVRASYILVNYNQPGDANNLNNAISFEMLEGLKPGKNYTWTAGLVKTLQNNLQITLQYNGRKSENSKTIHVGSAEVRAFF
jgi:hypothetical protein